jgi:septal ring factor EnvC (AmiA/AmiB activator)
LLVAEALALSDSARVHGQGSGGISTDVEIAGLLDEIETSTAKQDRFEREVSELSARHTEARRDLRTQVRALYRITRSGLSPLAGGMDAVLRHVARVKRLRRVVQKQALTLGSLENRQKSLRAESGRASQALVQARARLTALQSAPRSSSHDFPGLVSGYRPGAETSEYGLRLVDPAPSASFETERGNLASPVTGDVQIARGRRPEGDGPGLEFQAPVGTPVRAVAAGRVAFSDHYGSYGRLVILDHGGGYYTVYGGLGAVEVRVGDDLSRQARIGSIGGDFTPPALFFEVRKGTRTLEPRSWLGL